MALNKSTPGTRSGFLNDLTSSTGKQNNFIFPVRIKVTPNTSMRPLSDGKKNSTIFQPVLIKDLFSSSKKERQNTTITSVSTQKKKPRNQKSSQPYLNTQSCYKPKENGEESTFFNRKSIEGSKVRRQLYPNLDTSQKIAIESKENASKIIKPKKLNVTKNSTDKATKTAQTDNKIRKSFLMPPNTIKNSLLQSKPASKTSSKQTVRNSIVNLNQTKGSSQPSNTRRQTKAKRNSQRNSTRDFNFSSNPLEEKDQLLTMRDNFTMTSPSFDRRFPSNKVLNNINEFERPSVIMSPSRTKSKSKYFNQAESFSLETLNPTIDQVPCSCSKATQISNKAHENIDYNFAKMNITDYNGCMKLKSFLEQSLQTCQNQVLQLQQAIDCINNIFSSEITKSSTTTPASAKTPITTGFQTDKDEIAEKYNLSNTILVSQNSSITSNKSMNIDKSLEKLDISENASTLAVEIDEAKGEEKSEIKVEEKLPIPIKILVTNTDMSQESKEISLENLSDIPRLSTIGEVSCEISCEANESKKDEKEDSENKENVNKTAKKNGRSRSPMTPKTPRRRSVATEVCDTQNRRRSARLANKCKSMSLLSESDKQDSFTQLENELNVEYNVMPMPFKSLPASPLKVSLTPAGMKQWDKRIERPLKEYMALKMNGSFLVTPDIKKFQSRLEPTDTPHSRKSLSRKIFMELCDLYAESPEHH